MADGSKIEWTDASWNPVSGCGKVSQGCKNCYAERQWPRHYGRQTVSLPAVDGKSGLGNVPSPFTHVMTHPDRMEQPLRWKRPRRIFVNSMSDLFHESVPDKFISDVFGVMAAAHWHTFQILTKRPRRALELLGAGCMGSFEDDIQECMALYTDRPLVWPLPNVWMGVSVEDQTTADERIPLLIQTPAAVRWISAEPLLGPVDLLATPAGDILCRCAGCMKMTPDTRLDWVVVGGESGPKARPMHPAWARNLRDQCTASGVPFMFKQWGEWRPICQGEADWYRPFYRSRVHAMEGEDQLALDEIYGQRCTVPELCLCFDGEHAPISAPGAFLAGTLPVHAFKVGKHAAGRHLDGVLHDQYPS